MSLRATVISVGFLVAAGCKDDALPKFTPALMPPAASPLVLGKSTESDVLAKLGPARPAASPDDRVREIAKHEKLGGNGIVAYNEHPSIFINEPGFGEFYLWAEADNSVPVLGHFSIKQDQPCAWLAANVGKLEGAENCPGNRVRGIRGETGYLCLVMDDGRVVHAECGGSTISYSIGKKR
jgi:hypothetical protein